MSVNIATFLYLVSGVLFILALRGLSHPTTSRQGNYYGMTGMGISILTTLALAEPSFKGLGLIVIGLAIGGSVGAYIAKRIAMTAMPQLVAAFHSLVGLPRCWWPLPRSMRRNPSASARSAVFMARRWLRCRLGVAIGAITFTGSIIAFLKLDGRMSGKPIMLPGRHVINVALLIAIVVLVVALVLTESHSSSGSSSSCR